MKIESEDHQSFLHFTLCEVMHGNLPSMRFSIQASGPDVSGQIASAWFEQPNLEQFVQNILFLHQTGDGRAHLESMSPDEFSCEFFAINSRGHIGFGFSLSGSRQAESAIFPFTLSGGFQIDPSTLPQIAAELHAALAPLSTSL